MPTTAAAPTLSAASAPTLTTASASATANPTVGPGTSGTPARSGVVVTADFDDPISLDPAQISASPGRRACRAIYDPLVELDQNNNVIPALAQSWENPDPLTWVFHLQPGVKFHDGTDFDAAAVKFHFDRHVDPATKSMRVAELNSIASAEVVDTNTIRLHLKQAYPELLYVLFDWSGFIVSPAAVQKYGVDYGTHPVGTGPFSFVEYANNDHTLLQRNPNYWRQGLPYLDGVRIKAIIADATREVELRSGGGHIAHDLPYQDVGRITQMPEVVLSRLLGSRYDYWRWNCLSSPYGSSQPFRQAFNWAIDRQALHNAVFFNTGRVGYSPFHIGTPLYDPTYQPFTRDLDKAKALLDQAEVPQPAQFTIYTRQDPRTWLLYLRQGVTYPDGTPFDAEAVKFNIDRHLNPATQSKQIGELLSIDTVEIVDSSTVRFRLKAPSAGFLSPFVDRSGFMASPAAIQKWGNDNYGLHPVGVGPFQLVDHQDDLSHTVERNPNYWDKGKPYLDRITWKIIPLDATRLVELRSGGVHIAEDLPLENVDQMRNMPEIVLSELPGARFYFARWNMDNAFGKSLELRQAFNWTLDRAALYRAVFFNTGVVGFDPFLPGQPFYDANYRPYTRDLDKAKGLIANAQLPSPLQFTVYPDSGAVGQKLAQIMQANLADIGVNIDIQTEDQAASQARLDRSDWVLYMNSTGRFAYRPDPAQYLGSLWDSKSTYYKTGKLVDLQTDQLIESGEAESDPTRRYQIYRQLAGRINEVASAAFFEDASDFKGLSPKLRNYVHMPDVINRLKELWLDQ